MSCYDKGVRCCFVLSLILVACSYTTRRDDISLNGKPTKGEKQRLFIPVIDNLTTRTSNEGEITGILRKNLAAISGIEIVNSAEDAQFLMLGTIKKLETMRGNGLSGAGNPDSEASGGLAANQRTEADIIVTLTLQVRLMERLNADLNRQIWIRDFTGSATYTASPRLQESTGSSSAPYINDSRERIQIRSLADSLSKSIIDQAAQNF